MGSHNDDGRIDSLQLAYERKRLTELFRYFRSTSRAVHRDAVDIDSADKYQPTTARLSADPALNAFSQLACLRLNCNRAFISLIDDRNQHIVAETTQSISLYHQEKRDPGDELALGEMPLDLLAGVCAGTIKVFTSQDGRYDESTSNIFADRTRYVINDFALEDLYRARPYVKGFPYMRYYAEVPLVTPGGYVIGSFCVVDNKPRQGLSDEGYRILQEIASTIMRHLGLVKTDYEHMRAGLLLDGLNHFVQGEATALEMPGRRDEDIIGDVVAPSKILSLRGDVPWPVPRSKNSFSSDPSSAEIGEKLEHEQPSVGVSDSSFGLSKDAGRAEASLTSATAIHDGAHSLLPAAKPTRSPADSVSTRDQVSTNFQRASQILRQAMDLDGVVFISAVPDSLAPDRQCTGEMAKKLGYTVRENAKLINDAESPDQFSVPEALHRSLLATYPRGHVFVFDADESINNYTHSRAPGDVGDYEKPMVPTGRLRAKSEASNRNEINSVILANFPAARSMIFLPLWDLHKNQWFAGCIAWTTDVKRVLSSQEFGYFSAFGNSIMAEVARLELLATDLAKSDFISSISHELRSPLHGVLGSAELLRGMNLSDEQLQMMEMIETCGQTLLDTMEHILEHSKINSLKGGNSAFQKTRPARQGDNSDATDTHPRSEFDLSMLVEDTVEGTMAGHRFNVRSDASLNHWNRSTSPGEAHLKPATTQHPDVILNIAYSTNWMIKSDVGAWRRILLNLLGNALKYTASGFIEVALGSSAGAISNNYEFTTDIRLIVRDTGRGISQEYLQNHLYKPFMQEDTFSVGAGLGLSIVNKLVAGLGGRISVNSEVGLGTQVTVGVPVSSLARPSLSVQRLLHWPNARKLCLLTSNRDPQPGSTSFQSRSSKTNSVTALRNAFTIQAEQWFNLKVYPAHIITDVTADVVVLLESDTNLLEGNAGNNTRSTLLPDDVFLIILCSSVPTEMPPNLQGRANIQWLTQPIGPRKLARALANCFSESESGPAISMSSPTRLQESINGVDETLPTRRNEQQDRTAPSGPEVVPNGAEAPSNGPGAPRPGLVGQINSPAKTLHQDPSNPPDLTRTRAIQKPHLLLVDDNEINLKMLVVYMERLNCSYATATNGQQALEKYQASHQAFDYVLMDISMPIMDGFESTRQIRRFEREAGRTPSRIVALTGLGSGEAQREAFRSGVDLFLSKPVPMLKLKGIVEGKEG